MSCVSKRDTHNAIPTISDFYKEGENEYYGKVVFAIPYQDCGYFLMINSKSLTSFFKEHIMIGYSGKRNGAGLSGQMGKKSRKAEHDGSIRNGVVLRDSSEMGVMGGHGD